MTEQAEELRALRSLDPQGLAALHDRYFPEVYRYVRYRLPDDALAEDIVSDTFLRLLEAVHAGKGPRRNLRGWLIGTAFHLVQDHYRRHYRRPTEQMNDEALEHLAPDTRPTQRVDLKQTLQAALRHLTPEQQHVIALRFGAGLSLEETAAVMGKKANAIKALQRRALAALRRQLEAEEA